MTYSIDKFYDREYNEKEYNCLHFVREVWLDITGKDIGTKLATFMLPAQDRTATFESRQYFQRVDTPVEPSIVLMGRARTPPHVGIYIGGKVLHIHPRGVELQPVDVAMRGFSTVRYYICKQ